MSKRNFFTVFVSLILLGSMCPVLDFIDFAFETSETIDIDVEERENKKEVEDDMDKLIAYSIEKSADHVNTKKVNRMKSHLLQLPPYLAVESPPPEC
jgi:hypothetical protein